MKLEEYVNAEYTMKMNTEEVAAVQAALLTFKEEHGTEPEAQDIIRNIEKASSQITRTR